MTTITISATITSNIIKGGGGSQIPPSNLTAPVITGTGVVGQTLSVSDGTWAGSPIPTFSYQWKRDGVDIVGAIGNTYILDQPDATKVITCEVTATNIAGSASALSSNSLTVLDADASAFITAASITNATQITAINVLTNDLKGYGIWSKMKAIYPFVGGTASSHKFNLKDPRDLDAAFRLVFNGGWTHSSTGALPNGTNGFANTFFNSDIQLSYGSNSLSYYSRTNNTINSFEIGSQGNSPANKAIALRIRNTSNISTSANYNGALGNDFSNGTVTNSQGYFIANRQTTTSNKIIRNSVILNTNVINSNYSLNINNELLYIGGLNISGTPSLYSNRECAFSTIGDGLTDTDATNLYIATETFQTTLGRNVGVPIVSDPDAQAFLFAAQITNTTEANAVNQLVISLKAQGLWSKMKAIYPFVGGTASSHKFNLKDPRDLDAAFRLVFNGGVTHSSTGALFNGTNGYADSKLNPATILTNNNFHISYYGRTNFTSPIHSNEILSSNYSSANTIALRLNNKILGNAFFCSGNESTELIVASTTTAGYGIGSETSSSFRRYYKNNSILGTNTNNSTSGFGVGTMVLAGAPALNMANTECAFATIGDGLTDTDATNLYNTVQTFQTSLSRQV